VIAISAAGLAPTSDLPEKINGYCLALKSDGTIVAWGSGPVDLPPGLGNVLKISAGGYRALALVGDTPPVLQAAISDPFLDSNGFSCSIASDCGRVYRLERKELFTQGNWTASPLVAGNGGPLRLTDRTKLGSQRFYRVQRW